MPCCGSFFRMTSPPCCCAVAKALSESIFSRNDEKARLADSALYATSAPSGETPNGGAPGSRLPEQTMVLTVRRLGEPKYPLQIADFPSWPLVSLVSTDSNRAGCASGAHFKARPIIRLNACWPVYKTGSLVCGCAAAAGCAGVLSVGLLELHPAVRMATPIK